MAVTPDGETARALFFEVMVLLIIPEVQATSWLLFALRLVNQ